MNATLVTNQQEFLAGKVEFADGRPHEFESEAASTAESTSTAQGLRQSTTEARKLVLEELYTAHVEQIYKFAYSHVGNREDAEDITSQVFIKAATRLDINQAGCKQLAWLYQVARTTASDYWRQFYKMPTSSLDEAKNGAPD